jgi:hypothetical protein
MLSFARQLLDSNVAAGAASAGKFRRHIAGAPRLASHDPLQDPYATRGLPELSLYNKGSKHTRTNKADFWALTCSSMGFMERGSAISPLAW